MEDMHELLDDYRRFVDSGVSLNPDNAETRVELACFGLAGETGEVIDLIKKVKFHGRFYSEDDLVKELGDVFWYFTLLLDTLSIPLEVVMEENIRKLVERYPERHPELAEKYLPDADDLHEHYSGPDDYSDDAEALASAGFGTDEDYGG